MFLRCKWMLSKWDAMPNGSKFMYHSMKHPSCPVIAFLIRFELWIWSKWQVHINLQISTARTHAKLENWLQSIDLFSSMSRWMNIINMQMKLSSSTAYTAFTIPTMHFNQCLSAFVYVCVHVCAWMWQLSITKLATCRFHHIVVIQSNGLERIWRMEQVFACSIHATASHPTYK